MRMWMVNPRIMCDLHLLGEHRELHMFVGHVNCGADIAGYVKNNLLSYEWLWIRHHELVMEMEDRGMKHQSPLPDVYPMIHERLRNKYGDKEIDEKKALKELVTRCSSCRAKFRKIIIEKILWERNHPEEYPPIELQVP